jgi:hypothetical protein
VVTGCLGVEPAAGVVDDDVTIVVSSWIGRCWNSERTGLMPLVLVGAYLLVTIEVLESAGLFIYYGRNFVLSRSLRKENLDLSISVFYFCLCIIAARVLIG